MAYIDGGSSSGTGPFTWSDLQIDGAYCPKCKGVLNFELDGEIVRLQSDGDVTILVSRQRRVETYDGEFSMEERNPRITVTVVVPLNKYVRQLQELCDKRVVVQLCDGRSFSAEHASNVADVGYDAKKNVQQLELICTTIKEMLPRSMNVSQIGIGGAGVPF